MANQREKIDQMHFDSELAAIFHKIAGKLLGFEKIEKIYNWFVQEIANDLKVQNSAIILFASEHPGLSEIYLEGFPELKSFSFLQIEEGWISEIIKTKFPKVLRGDEKNLPESLSKLNLITAPIYINQKPRGIILAGGKNGIFTEMDFELMSFFSEYLAMLKKSESHILDSDELETLRKTTLAITESIDHETLLEVICESTANLLKAKGAGVFENDVENLQLVRIAAYGLSQELIRSTLKYGEGVAGKLINNQEPYAVAENSQTGVMRKILETPLIHAGKRTGILYVDDLPERNYSERDAHLLQMMADHVVIAIKNNEHFKEISSLKDHQKRLVDNAQDGIITTDMDGNITDANAKAEEILEYKTQEILRTPVNQIYFDSDELLHVHEKMKENEKGKLHDYETVFKNKKGEKIPVRLSTSWLLDNNKKPVGAVGYFRDLREIEENERHRQLLLEASRVVAGAGSLQEGLERLAEKMTEAIGVTFCSVLLAENGSGNLVISATNVVRRKSKINWIPKKYSEKSVFINGVMKEIFSEEKPLVCQTCGKHEKLLQNIQDEIGFPGELQSLLILPLRAGDKQLGLYLMGEMRKLERKSFSEKEVDLARSLANHLSTLIEKVHLLDKAKENEEAVQNLNRLLSILDEATRRIKAVVDNERLPHEIIHQMQLLIKADIASFLFYHPAQKLLEIKAVSGLKSHWVGQRFSSQTGIWQRVCEQKTSNLIRIDSSEDVPDSLLKEFQPGSTLIIPLIESDEIQALIIAGKRATDSFFSETNIDIINRFAASAAITLQTSQLINREKRLFSQMSILKNITNHIHESRDLDKILHLILTGITAGYGLGFNRAALLMLDEEEENLIGELAIGQEDLVSAEADWEKHHKNGLESFEKYVQVLEKGKIKNTPLHKKLKNLIFPFHNSEKSFFINAKRSMCCVRVQTKDFDKLQEEFRNVFEPVTEMVIVPLIVGEKTIGFVVADNKFTEAPISDITIENLQAFANSAAIAYEKARSIKERERQVRERESLLEISNDLSTKRSIEEVLKTLLLGGQKLLNVEMIIAHLVTKVEGKYQSYYFPKGENQEYKPPRQKCGLTTKVINEKRIIRINDTEKDGKISENLKNAHIKSVIAYPLIIGGNVIGALFFASKKKNFFKDPEESLVSLLVRHAAGVIENIRFMEKLDINAQLNAELVEVGQSLSEAHDLDCFFRIIKLFLTNNLHPSTFSISLVDIITQKIQIRSYEESQLTHITAMPDETGFLGYVIQKGESIRWSSTREREKLENELGRKACSKEMLAGSYLVYPLKTGENISGAICLQSNLENAWDDLEQNTFQTFSRLVATSLQNTQLIHEIREGNEKLAAAYSASKEIISARDPDKVLNDIVRRIVSVMNAWRASVILIDEEGNPRHLASWGFKEYMERATAIRKNGLSIKIKKSGKPLYIENLETTTFDVHPKIREQDVKAAVCLPLEHFESNRGVLWLHFKEPRRFSELDKQCMQLYASQAAIAYENARQMQELEQMQKAVEALSSTDKISDVMKQIAQSACLVLNADSAAIWSYDQQHEKFVSKESVSSGIPEAVWAKFQKDELTAGQTARKVLSSPEGWIGVEEVWDEDRYTFIGSSTKELLEQVKAQSFLGLRISVGEEVLGVLYLNYQNKRSFQDQNEIKTALTFATHAYLALKNARLLEELERVRKNNNLVSELTNLGDLDETLQSVVDATLDVLHCDVVVLYPYYEKSDKFGYPPKMKGVKKEGGVLQLGEVKKGSVPYKIVKLDDLHAAEDSLNDPIMKGFFIVREEVKSSIGIPLICMGQKVGVMFGNYRQPHHFKKPELENFRAFAHQAAIAIYNARLFQQQQKRAEALSALNEAGTVVTSSLDLDVILSSIAEQARYLTGEKGSSAMFSMILQVVNGNAKIKAIYPPEQKEKVLSGTGLELETFLDNKKSHIVNKVIRTGKSQLMAGEIVDKQQLLHSDSRSELAVPIKFNEELIGIIYVGHTESTVFDEEDQRDLELLAAYAGAAIENARQYEYLRSIKGYIGNSTAINWIRMVSQNWGHSIKRDSSTVRNQAEVIKMHLKEKINNEATAIFNEMDTLLEKIGNTPITAPLSIEDAVDNVGINTLIETYVSRIISKEPYKQVCLKLNLMPELDKKATVWASREWLRRGIEIIVNNAIEALLDPENNKPDQILTIHSGISGDFLFIRFEDNGPGMSDEIQKKYGKEPVESKKGAGVGAALAGTIAETYGGRLILENSSPEGTMISLLLPINKTK